MEKYSLHIACFICLIEKLHSKVNRYKEFEMSTLSSAKRMISLIHKYKVFLNFASLRTRLTITLCTRSRFFDATESTSNTSDVISQKHQQSALLPSENRSFRWDPNSGQFSFSQDHDSLLARGIEVVDDLSSSHPDSIAIIQRKYHEKHCQEVVTAFILNVLNVVDFMTFSDDRLV